MLTIRRPQIDVLGAAFAENYVLQLTDYLIGRFRADARVLGEAGVHAIAQRGVATARACGLDNTGDVTRFVVLVFFFGSAFVDDPQLPWARAALAGAEPAPRRIDRLYAAAADWLRVTAGQKGEYYRAALLRNYRRQPDAYARLALADGAEGERAWLRDVFPHKAERVGAAELDRVAVQAAAGARRHGLSGRGAQRMVAALAFMLGTHFDDDPLYPWVPALLARAATVDPAEAGAALHGWVGEQIGVYLRAGAEIGA